MELDTAAARVGNYATPEALFEKYLSPIKEIGTITTNTLTQIFYYVTSCCLNVSVQYLLNTSLYLLLHVKVLFAL